MKDDFSMYAALAEVYRESMGEAVTPEDVKHKLERISRGTGAEYHFAALAVWGGATLVQRIDDSHSTTAALSSFKVPDIWMVIPDRAGNLHPCWVEVKSSARDDVYRVTAPYHERMRAFRELTGDPYLVAFRNKWGLWTLIDIDNFKPGPFRIGVGDLRNSLMGLLLNDHWIVVPEGAGVTIQLARLGEEMEETDDGWRELVRVDDLYAHRSDGTRIEESVPWLHYVMFSVQDDTHSTVNDEDVIERFSAVSDSTMWMQQVFGSMASFGVPDDEDIDWRDILANSKDYMPADELTNKLYSSGFISHVLYMVPSSIPTNFRDFDPQN